MTGIMSRNKCCSSRRDSKENCQLDSDISAEREEILLQPATSHNGRLSQYENVQSSQNSKEDFTKRKIRDLVRYYINHCTLHGFHYVFETKSILRKIVWLTILAVAAGFFFKEIKTSLTQYYLYPFTTTSTMQYPGELPFPAITICDFHDIRKHIRSSNPKKMSGVMDTSLQQFNKTLILSTLFRGYDKPILKFNITEFDVFYSSKGQTCYSFNTGKSRPVLQGNKVGSKYGLEFTLNIQHPNYSDVRESGFRFILHQQDEVPLTSEGFRVSPGYITYVNLKLTKEKNLPSPYKSNCGGRRLNYFTKYSSSNCYLELLTEYVISVCQCRIWFMPDTANASNCSVKQTLDCVWPAWEKFELEYNYTCPEDCEKTTYDAKLSSALYMPQKLIPVKTRYKHLLRPDDLPTKSEDIVDYIMENYVVVTLYFDDLRLDVIEQTAAYGFYRLVGDVGGQLGLVLGASFITLLELVDLSVMAFYFWLRGVIKKRSSRRT